MIDKMSPTGEQDEQVSDVPFRDPFGDDPKSIPDPMPDDLLIGADEDTAAEFEGTEGDAPTG